MSKKGDERTVAPSIDAIWRIRPPEGLFVSRMNSAVARATAVEPQKLVCTASAFLHHDLPKATYIKQLPRMRERNRLYLADVWKSRVVVKNVNSTELDLDLFKRGRNLVGFGNIELDDKEALVANLVP